MNDDIQIIDKTLIEKTNIENICINCSDYLNYEVTSETRRNAEGVEETIEVIKTIQLCTITGKSIVFSNLKTSETCPKGLW
jgi:hypothetical protein